MISDIRDVVINVWFDDIINVMEQCKINLFADYNEKKVKRKWW